MVIRSFALRTEDDLRLLDDYPGTPILADSYAPGLRGGTGRIVDWNLARRVMKTHPLILSGGLSPDNISEALAAVSPDAVDINSGVETAPGKKDPEKIRAIVDLIRRSEGTAVANGERIFRLSARL
jgi:phosphoribosylanthranilate isomerase